MWFQQIQAMVEHSEILLILAKAVQSCAKTGVNSTEKQTQTKPVFSAASGPSFRSSQFCKQKHPWADPNVRQPFIPTLPPKISPLNYKTLQVLQYLEIFPPSIFTILGLVQLCGQLSFELDQGTDVSFCTFALKHWSCKEDWKSGMQWPLWRWLQIVPGNSLRCDIRAFVCTFQNDLSSPTGSSSSDQSINWQMLLIKTFKLNECPGLIFSSWLKLDIIVFKHSGWRGGGGKWPPKLSAVRTLQQWKCRIPHASQNVHLSMGYVFHTMFAFSLNPWGFVSLPTKGRGIIIIWDSFNNYILHLGGFKS